MTDKNDNRTGIRAGIRAGTHPSIRSGAVRTPEHDADPETDPASRPPTQETPTISVAVQGGAMRSIYCIGAIRAIAENNLAGHIRSIHAASAGSVSACLLTAIVSSPVPVKVEDITATLLDSLATTRFINPRRPRRVVDVDYLTDVLIETTGLSLEVIKDSNIVSEVVLTDASNGEPIYADLAGCASMTEVRDALRGTMAIPVLYPVAVRFRGRRVYDGGIVDPLPIGRALGQPTNTVIAITNVAKGTLGDPPAEGTEARILRAIPLVPRPVREKMLNRIVLGDRADEALTTRPAHHNLVAIWPSDPDILGSRLETRREHLAAVEALGYADATTALRALALADPGTRGN